jgi:protein-tyrosine phosphatase
MKILFVCMGNICRSPTAETIFKNKLKNNDLEAKIQVDSCGIIDYHVGEKADARMRKHASKRGHEIKSIARQFNPENDFNEFDYIIVMDDDNLNDIHKLDPEKKHRHKVHKMTDFSQKATHYDHIPDPYYGGTDGFEIVIDMLEDACEGLVIKVKDSI